MPFLNPPAIVPVVDAFELYDLTQKALTHSGPPEWNSPEEQQEREQLLFLPGTAPDAPTWAMGRADDEAGAVVVDVGMACDLIRGHLQGWLAHRGWQVQMSMRGQRRTWRLADCLSAVDGGGDRLEADYPAGEDELTVLCAAVVAVASAI